MALIPESFINDLMNKVDIVDVIDSRVPLKKTGREYQACCPFHTEKTPSFTVSPQKQFYHCFGCGAHGTAIGFIMDYDRLEFPDAIRALAESVGMEVPVESGSREDRQDNQKLYDLMETAANYYRGALKGNERAIEYLKGRGLTGEIAAEFGLGFAPDSWEGLMEHLRQRGFRKEQITTTGMGIPGKQDKPYDRFRDRIMFPIRDRRGRVIAFGGRVLDKGEPKYLNSPETPLFHKGRELYGLWEAKQANREIARLVVVEGYMDVVALAQSDIRYAVATLGTATTPEHLDRLFRVTREVVFCFDGDKAGRRAAWRALENSLESIRDGRQLKFLFLPEGEDPDTLVRKEGKAAFEARLDAAQPLSEFLLDRLAAQVDLGSIEGRARLVDLAKPLIARIPDAVFRDLMEQKLSQAARMDTERLGRLMGGNNPPQGRQAAPRHSRAPALTPVRRAILLLMLKPSLVEHAAPHQERLGELDIPGTDVLVRLLEFLTERPDITLPGLLEAWRDDPMGPALAKLASATLEIPEEGMEAEFLHVLERQLLGSLHEKARTERLRSLQGRRPSELSDAEKAELRALLGAESGRTQGQNS
ncbi:MAG: DNA primase [Gammaproteobacteria bacterium]|nr:DNA primase [Gammaproteobacteria bacterium]